MSPWNWSDKAIATWQFGQSRLCIEHSEKSCLCESCPTEEWSKYGCYQMNEKCTGSIFFLDRGLLFENKELKK